MAIDLDIGSLEKAIASLEAALVRHDQTPNEDLVRDACVHRFKFNYDLSYKTLKRFLKATAANPTDYDSRTFQDLIHAGSERGLLMSDWSRWKQYREARSLTSYTYDETKAREVLAIIPEFFREVRYLRDKLGEAIS